MNYQTASQDLLRDAILAGTAPDVLAKQFTDSLNAAEREAKKIKAEQEEKARKEAFAKKQAEIAAQREKAEKAKQEAEKTRAAAQALEFFKKYYPDAVACYNNAEEFLEYCAVQNEVGKMLKTLKDSDDSIFSFLDRFLSLV